MKAITTRTHGILDYIVSLFVIAMPWLLGFAQGGYETWIPVILGLTSIIYSLLTNYELGALRVIPMRVHLILDTVSGLLLLASPWLFGFSDYVSTPHVVTGLVELLVVVMSQKQPSLSMPGFKARAADNVSEY